jgi:hypothetical protein
MMAGKDVKTHDGSSTKAESGDDHGVGAWKSNMLQSLTLFVLEDISNIAPWRFSVHSMLDLPKDSRAVTLLARCNWRCLVFALDCITWASKVKQTVSSETSVPSRSSQTVRRPGIGHLVSGTAKDRRWTFLTSSRRRHRQIGQENRFRRKAGNERNRCVKTPAKKPTRHEPEQCADRSFII